MLIIYHNATHGEQLSLYVNQSYIDTFYFSKPEDMGRLFITLLKIGNLENLEVRNLPKKYAEMLRNL